MSKNKDDGKSTIKPKVKPKVVAKVPSNKLTPDQQARFGVGSGPVSGTEMARIKRATQNKAGIESKGGTYFSPWDTAKGGAAGGGSEAAGEAAATEFLNKQRIPGGGGGAGTPGRNASLDAYTRLLQSMLNKGSYSEPSDDLMTGLQGLYGQGQTDLQSQYDTGAGKLKELMGTAGGTINTSMDNLQSALQAQKNPYESFVAQQAQAVPGLNELLASQGVSSDPVARLAAAFNTGNAGQAAGFQNLANSLGTIWGANQQGMIGDVAQQRAGAQTDLANQGFNYGQQLSGNLVADKGALSKQLLTEQSTAARGSADAQSKLLQQLLAAIQAGGALGKGGLSGS